METVTEEMKAILRRSGSDDHRESSAAMQMLAKAMATPLREIVLEGDLGVDSIFEPIQFDQGQSPEFPWILPELAIVVTGLLTLCRQLAIFPKRSWSRTASTSRCIASVRRSTGR